MSTDTPKPLPFGRKNGGHPNYEANLAKTPHQDQTAACCFCGKNTGHGRVFAYLLDVGDFAKKEDYAHLADDTNLGFYPVGSDCARKLKAAGIAIYTWEGKRV